MLEAVLLSTDDPLLLESDLSDDTWSLSVRKDGHETLSLLDNKAALRWAVTVVEFESVDLNDDSSVDSDTLDESSPVLRADNFGVIQQAFADSQSQWIEDPVITSWRSPDHRINAVLSKVNSLYKEWISKRIGPLGPVTDPLWLQTGRILAEVGLPWHNNQINMPDEIDTSWPFHFKSFEMQVLKAKGARVGDGNPSGYVCNYYEANLYSIRTLQQELRERCPTRQPLLVYDRFDEALARSAQKLFGLQLYHADLSKGAEGVLQSLKHATHDGLCPIIFAATLANADGEHDDLGVVAGISQRLPLILHVEASRNFDYITTLPDVRRQQLGIAKLTLGVKTLDRPIRSQDGSIIASTIVAGGSNHSSPAAVVTLKPARLGTQQARVAYTRATDSTLAGSRDALAPLWMALQEIRFGESGFRQVYEHCTRMRASLMQVLKSGGVLALAPNLSLDVILKNCSKEQKQKLLGLGGELTSDGNVVLTVQPSVTPVDVESAAATLLPTPHPGELDNYTCDKEGLDSWTRYPVPQPVIDELKSTVQSWRVATRSAAGYPFHMGSYSALGPVTGHFLDVDIPSEWTQARSKEILDARMEAFGLRGSDVRANFEGAFTNGSTMGNRVGIHMALSHSPGAYLYFSSECHYSVMKTLRDDDTLTNRWTNGAPRYSQLPCNVDGSMSADALVRQALADREHCRRQGTAYSMVLFANMGTTFVGARDDLKQIHARLREVGLSISYTHVDGALDFGFDDCGIQLGPPGATDSSGAPLVQGVTLSHHKALGGMVSGEVLCFSPGDRDLATLGSSVDPRAIFETWLYGQIYAPADLGVMSRYCRDNAALLEAALRRIGVVTKRNNPGGLITVLERPPAWIIEEFSLRPEGDWVHFITMPHISPETVDFFVDRIATVDRQCRLAFSYVSPALAAIMDRPVELRRLQCRQPLAEQVRTLSRSLVPVSPECGRSMASVVEGSLRGALSVAAVDSEGQIQAVFLAESTRHRSIRAGPILLHARHSGKGAAIIDVAKQLLGFMARHTYARLRADETSYELYSF